MTSKVTTLHHEVYFKSLKAFFVNYSEQKIFFFCSDLQNTKMRVQVFMATVVAVVMEVAKLNT